MARDSLFHAFADSLSRHLTRESPQPEKAYLAMMSTIYSLAASVCPGEWVYVPNGNPIELEQSRQRIAIALQAGEAPPQIARREGVTERTVRRLRGQIRP